MNDGDLRASIIGLLRDDGYEIGADLESRLDQFLACIRKTEDQNEVGRLLDWLEMRRQLCAMSVEEIPMSQVKNWQVDPDTGAISHVTGEFFRVIGIKIENASQREAVSWCQPIIYQPEMGILGILVQRRDGVDHYLLQAKAEPGNIGKLQLSPTLQSTVSNLRRAHGGLKSPFANLFEHPHPGAVIYAKYQGEDGGRLRFKKNLNMLVRVAEEEQLEIPDDFVWVTMYQIKQLLKFENVVNIAARSVLSVL